MSLMLSPYIHALIAGVILIALGLFQRLDSCKIMLYGFNLGLLWITISTFVNVFRNNLGWNLLHLSIAVLAFYAVWIGFIALAEKFGKSYWGDGGLGIIVPGIIFPFALLLALSLKGIYLLAIYFF
jgi:hypothetical protein